MVGTAHPTTAKGSSRGAEWLRLGEFGYAPVDEVDFDVLAAFEFVDDGFVGDVERGVGGDEVVVPFSAAEGDAADGGALLEELHG